MLIIRRQKELDLILAQSSEGVFFLFQHGQMVDNSLEYDVISNKYDDMIKKSESI